MFQCQRAHRLEMDVEVVGMTYIKIKCFVKIVDISLKLYALGQIMENHALNLSVLNHNSVKTAK